MAENISETQRQLSEAMLAVQRDLALYGQVTRETAQQRKDAEMKAKYGIENFTKEVLHIFESEEEMNAKEKELVVISEQTYNLNEGGHGGFGYINSKGLNKENLKLGDRKSTRLNSSHSQQSRMPSSA